MNEEKILHQLQRGNPKGLDALMDRYLPYVSAVVWNIVRGMLQQEDAEEIVSDVFLAAWEHADTLVPQHLRCWLGAVARNKAKNALRDAGKQLCLEEDEADIPVPDVSDDTLIRQERQTLVRRALESLPAEDRGLFLRYYFYAQSIAEIADALSLNPATVKTRLRRGRAKLKAFLLQEGYDETDCL